VKIRQYLAKICARVCVLFFLVSWCGCAHSWSLFQETTSLLQCLADVIRYTRCWASAAVGYHL